MSQQARILVVESNPGRRARMTAVAKAVGLEVGVVDRLPAALASMRQHLPDILWAGVELGGSSVVELFDLVAAAWPQLPRLAVVRDQEVGEHLVLLENGAFDLVREEDEPPLWHAALRRALTDVRAKEAVREERGRFLTAQARVTAMAPATLDMLTGLGDSLRDALGQPDISLRKVETVCARTLSTFLDGATVVVMAYERSSGVLRPRGTSHPSSEHERASQHGFLLTEDLDAWKEELNAVGEHEPLAQLVRETYSARQVLLCVVGPEREPYGVAAFLTQHATPVAPADVDLLHLACAQVGQCIRVARVFRQLLRRGVTGA